MTSGELNIDLTQKKNTKAVGLSMNYQMPFTVCRSDSWFFISEGGSKVPHPIPNLSAPVRNKVKKPEGAGNALVNGIII